MAVVAYIWTCVLIWLLAPSLSYALTITEVYPNAADGETEWVEVYNDQTSPLETNSIFLEDKTGKKLTFADTTINALSYALATSTGVLNNTGDTVSLKESTGTIIETLDYPTGIQTGMSYQKCADGTWVVASTTRMQDNAPSCHTPPSTQSPTATESFDSILVTEIHPNPVEGNEWIELYNSSDSSIQLTDWYMDDEKDAGSKPMPFSLSIDPKSFARIMTTSSMLNNSGDIVRFLKPDGSEVFSTSYPTIAKGISYGRRSFGDSSYCMQDISQGSIMSTCIVDMSEDSGPISTKSTSTPTRKVTPTPTKKPTRTPTTTRKSSVLGASVKKATPVPPVVRRDSAVLSALEYKDTGQTQDNPHKKSALLALLSLSSAVGAGLLTVKKIQQ